MRYHADLSPGLDLAVETLGCLLAHTAFDRLRHAIADWPHGLVAPRRMLTPIPHPRPSPKGEML